MKYFILILLAVCGAAVAATEYGLTIRAVELKAQPNADAASVATLPEKTRVEVLKRQGAWFEVKATGGNGWLRMLTVRGEGGGENAAEGGAKKPSGRGLSMLGSLVTTGTSGTPVATGVRGLSEEDLSHAQENPAELEKLQALASNPQEARKFAEQVKLKSQSIAYLPSGKTQAKGDAK